MKIFTIAALAAVMSVSPAAALDFTEVLINAEGCPFRNLATQVTTTYTAASEECKATYVPEERSKPDLTLGTACYHALLVSFPDEQNVTGEEKFRRGELASIVRSAKDYTPSSEEVTLMKKVLAKLYSPGVVFAAYRKLDPSYKARGAER